VAGFAALGMAFSASVNDILDIKGLRFSAIHAFLNLLPHFVEANFPQSILVF